MAVLPFRVNANDAEYLEEGMVDLLSAQMWEQREARPVDPWAVISAWRP